MLLRPAFVAIGMLIAAPFQTFAQPSIPPGPIEIDLDKATSQLKEIFEQTCYIRRHSLRSLIAEPPAAGFAKIPRQYPVHDAVRRTTLLAEWGIFTRSGPYLVGLYDNDLYPDVTLCTINAVAIRKSTLKDVISQIDGLQFFEEKQENETDIIGFMHKHERALRVLCMTPKTENLFIADCHLWSWSANGSQQ